MYLFILLEESPFCRHAHRSTINIDDVKLLARRNPSLVWFPLGDWNFRIESTYIVFCFSSWRISNSSAPTASSTINAETAQFAARRRRSSDTCDRSLATAIATRRSMAPPPSPASTHTRTCMHTPRTRGTRTPKAPRRSRRRTRQTSLLTRRSTWLRAHTRTSSRQSLAPRSSLSPASWNQWMMAFLCLFPLQHPFPFPPHLSQEKTCLTFARSLRRPKTKTRVSPTEARLVRSAETSLSRRLRLSRWFRRQLRPPHIVSFASARAHRVRTTRFGCQNTTPSFRTRIPKMSPTPRPNRRQRQQQRFLLRRRPARTPSTLWRPISQCSRRSPRIRRLPLVDCSPASVLPRGLPENSPGQPIVTRIARLLRSLRRRGESLDHPTPAVPPQLAPHWAARPTGASHRDSRSSHRASSLRQPPFSGRH